MPQSGELWSGPADNLFSQFGAIMVLGNLINNFVDGVNSNWYPGHLQNGFC
jgi:hypothetical protein